MDDEGYTPLYKAALEGNLNEVEDLISQEANLDKPSKGGLRPLHAAAQEGHEDVVDFLILHGADPSVECDMGQTPLHKAALEGKSNIIDSLIAEGSDINKGDTEGFTPFNAAIYKGHLQAAKYLLDKGAKHNRYDRKTPLYAAAQFGHLDIVEYFISNGADVNEVDDDGMIPLHGAACEGHLDIMEYLTELGSDVNKADPKGYTPFHAAIEYGHLEAVKYLLDKGAKQNRYDGMTPLYAAALSGHLDIVKFFISKRADVNEVDDDGMIPLHGAASEGHLDIMEYLTELGSDVNKADPKGYTPFHAAIEYGHLEAVKYLLDKGAKQNRYDGMTPLYAAAQSGHLDIVRFFISNGADVNEENDDGTIALHGAAIDGNIKIIDYLIQCGSDVNRDDGDGWTPFSAAVENGHLEAVKHLLRKGAVQKRFDGMTPLYIAVQAGHLDIVRFLISNGADVNEADDDGMIALHAAARKGNIELVKYLIQHGTNVNKAGNNGLTPLNASITEGHLKVVEYLLAKGAKCVSTEIISPLYIATQFNQLEVAKVLVSKGYNVNEGTKSGKSPLHAACYNGNIDMIDFLLLNNADVDKQDQDGWTPLQAAAQEGHIQVVKYLSVRCENMKDMDAKTLIKASPNKDHSTRRIKGSLSTGVCAQIATLDEQYKSHQNAITAEDLTASSADPQTQSCSTHIEQSKLLVHNIHNENAFIHAETIEESWDGKSFKALPTGSHHHEDDANGERTPFFGAQPKSPDKPEHDPTQDHFVITRTRNNEANKNGLPKSSEHQTWDSGLDPQFLRTLNSVRTSAELPEDGGSTWHHLDEDIGQTRKCSKPIITRRDPSIERASLESNSTSKSTRSPVAHQNFYGKQYISYITTSSVNKLWRILSKHRNTRTGGPPPVLMILKTFLRLFLASASLAFLLAGCAVHVAGNGLKEKVTLLAGSRGVVPFHFPWSANDTSEGPPYFTIWFESQDQPFCKNGIHEIDGFKSSTQSSRYTTSVTRLDTGFVNLFIDDVDTVDQDRYIFDAIWHELGDIRHEVIKKEVTVKVPPGSAKCFITLNDNCAYGEVRCRATTGSVGTSLSCYQNDEKLNILDDISDDGQKTSGTFCLLHDTAFSCCSHEVTSNVSAATCNDFQWPPRVPGKRTTTQNIPESRTDISISSPTYTNLETSQMTEFDINSGAGRQQPPFLKYLLYPLIHVLHFVY